MHIAQALDLGDRHPPLDESLLRLHDLLRLDVGELLHEVLSNGFQLFAARQALNESAQASLPRLRILTDNGISAPLERCDDLREVDPLHCCTARDRHDAPHHVQRDGICNLLEPDLRHDILNLGILLHQLSDRLFQVEYLFHRQSSFYVNCSLSSLYSDYNASR